MTHHWDPADVRAEDLTGVFDLADISDGDTFVWDEAAGLLVAGEAGSGGKAELLVMDGSSPPELLTLEDGTDYLYEDT